MKKFIAAAKNGNLLKLQSALQSNPSLIDQTGKTGSTALNWAIYRRHFSCAEYLVKQGADPHIKDHYNTGYTPFDWSITQIELGKQSQALKKQLLTLLLSSSKTDRKKLSNKVTHHTIYQEILSEERGAQAQAAAAQAQAAAAQAQAAAADNKKTRTSTVFENLLKSTSKQLLSPSSKITVDFRSYRNGYSVTLSNIANHTNCSNIVQIIAALFPGSLEEYHYDDKTKQLRLLFPPEITLNTKPKKTRFFTVIQALEIASARRAAVTEAEKQAGSTESMLQSYLRACGVDYLDILLLHHYNGTLELSCEDGINTINITFSTLDSQHIATSIAAKLPKGTQSAGSQSISIELDKATFEKKYKKAELAETQQVRSLTKTGALTKSFNALTEFYADFMRGLEGERPKLRSVARRKHWTIHSDGIVANKTNPIFSALNISREPYFKGKSVKKEKLTRQQSTGVANKYAYVYLWRNSLPLIAYPPHTTIIRRVVNYNTAGVSYNRVKMEVGTQDETDTLKTAVELREKYIEDGALFETLEGALEKSRRTNRPCRLEVLAHLPISAEGASIMALEQTPTAILQSLIMHASMQNQTKKDIALLQLILQQPTAIQATALSTSRPARHPAINYTTAVKEMAKDARLYALVLLLHTAKAHDLTIRNTVLYSLSSDRDLLQSIRGKAGKTPQQEICHLFLIQKGHATYLKPKEITPTTYPTQTFIDMLNMDHPEVALNPPLLTQLLESHLLGVEKESGKQDILTEKLLLLILEKHKNSASSQQLERLSRCAGIQLKKKSIGILLSRKDKESTEIINRFIDHELLTIKALHFPYPTIARRSVRELLKRRAGTSTSLYPEDIISLILREKTVRALPPKDVFSFFNTITLEGVGCLMEYKATLTGKETTNRFHILTGKLLKLNPNQLARLSHHVSFQNLFLQTGFLSPQQCFQFLKIIATNTNESFHKDLEEIFLTKQAEHIEAPTSFIGSPKKFFSFLTALLKNTAKGKRILDYDTVKTLAMKTLQSPVMLKKLLSNSLKKPGSTRKQPEPSFVIVCQLLNLNKDMRGSINVFSAIKAILDEHPKQKEAAYSLISELTTLKAAPRLFMPESIVELITSHPPTQDQFFSFFKKEKGLPTTCLATLTGNMLYQKNKDLAELIATEASKNPCNRDVIQIFAEALEQITTAGGSTPLEPIANLSIKLTSLYSGSPIPKDCQTLLNTLLESYIRDCLLENATLEEIETLSDRLKSLHSGNPIPTEWQTLLSRLLIIQMTHSLLEDPTQSMAISENLANNIAAPGLHNITNMSLVLSLLPEERLTEIFSAHPKFVRQVLSTEDASDQIRKLAVTYIQSSESAKNIAQLIAAAAAQKPYKRDLIQILAEALEQIDTADGSIPLESIEKLSINLTSLYSGTTIPEDCQTLLNRLSKNHIENHFRDGLTLVKIDKLSTKLTSLHSGSPIPTDWQALLKSTVVHWMTHSLLEDPTQSMAISENLANNIAAPGLHNTTNMSLVLSLLPEENLTKIFSAHPKFVRQALSTEDASDQIRKLAVTYIQSSESAKNIAQLISIEASQKPYNRNIIQILAEALEQITTADGSITLKTIEELSTKLKNLHPGNPIPAHCQNLLKTLLFSHANTHFRTAPTLVEIDNLSHRLKNLYPRNPIPADCQTLLKTLLLSHANTHFRADTTLEAIDNLSHKLQNLYPRNPIPADCQTLLKKLLLSHANTHFRADTTLEAINKLSLRLTHLYPEDPIPADCQTLLKSLLANHLSACFLDDTTTTVALTENLATNIEKPKLQRNTNINLAVSLLSNEALTEIFKAHSDFARLALTADLASEEIRALAVMHIDSSEPAEAAAEQEGNLSKTKLAIHRNFFSEKQPDLQPLREQLHALSHTQFLTATIYLSTIGQGLVSHRSRRRKLAFLFIQAYIAVRSKGAAHYHSGRNTQSKGSKLEAAREIVAAVRHTGNTLFKGAKNKANRWGTVGYLTDILSREDKGLQV